TCPVDSGYFIMLPSLTGVVVILAAFALFAVVTFWELTRSKTTTYSLILITGLALDILGYVGTLLLRSDLASKTYFLVFLLGTTMGPTLITAAIYTVLPHIMALYGSDVSIGLSPGWIVCFLFLLDISTLFLQALGSAFAAEGFDKIEEGTNFIVAGLILQIMSILVFFGVYLCFMFRVAQSRQFLDPRFSYVYLSLKFKTTMLCLNLSLLFILVRTVARIVQFSSGLSSSLSQSQFYLPVLDGGLVLLAVFLLTIAHPPSAFGDAWTTTSPRN
ncbi:hypothetical protein M406DRAFT_231054, partial [Cryphonectria parasitica EP155]